MRVARVAMLAMLLGSGCKGILGIESGVVGGPPDDARADALDDASDAEIDAEIDAPPIDARTCFGTFQEICLEQPVPDTFDVAINTTVSTCTEMQTVGGVSVCIRSAKHITVSAGATLQASGSPFVVLVATEDITIAGTLDGWNAGVAACGNNDASGAGSGGPGGSFATTGGIGGVGGSGGGLTFPLAPVNAVPTFRRGCSGGDGGSVAPPAGPGGAGGSGIFLVAPAIHLASTARINASGFGGEGGQFDRGGGGGGSGGLIVLDSESLQIDAGAIVIALGGGGGGGGGNADSAEDGTRTTNASPGQGGEGAAGASGNGGDASVAGAANNGGGGTNGRGGGGGGGGVGVIFATATTLANTGTVVPALRAP